jgi:hypothetical protein
MATVIWRYKQQHGRYGLRTSYIYIADKAQSLMDKALKFMNDDDGDDSDDDDTIVIKTVGHNVQRLLAHKEDIETDFV